MSGYAKIEVRKKSGKFLKPNDRESKIVPNKSKFHSIEMNMNFRGKTCCQYLVRDSEVSDTAAIRECKGPTCKWRLGRIRNLYLGNNGYVKAVDLATDCGTITRSIGNLVILPAN